MKKNKKVLFLIGLFLSILLAYCFSFIFINYRVLKNSHSIRKLDNNRFVSTNFNNDNNQFVSVGDSSEYNYTFDDSVYVEYLKFNYNATDRFSWIIEYNYEDDYGNVKNRSIQGMSSNKINIFSEKIHDKVSNIRLIINSGDIVINDIRVDNSFVFMDSFYASIISLIVALYLCIFFRKFLLCHLEYVFLIIALTFGVAMFSNYDSMVGKSWDDQIHFQNSYLMATNKMSNSSIIMSDYSGEWQSNTFNYFNTSEEKKAFKEYLNRNSNKGYVDDIEENTDYSVGIISKIGYVHMSLIIKISLLLKIPFSIMYNLGMIINFILYVVLCFVSIKKVVKLKSLFLICSLIPTTLFMACSYSYDPPLTGFILLGLSLFINEFIDKKNINIINIIIIALSFSISSCIKVVYAPLLLLLLLLPKTKFKNKKQYVFFLLSCLLLFVMLMMIIIGPILINMITDVPVSGDSRGGNTSVSEQLKLIISSPISFLRVLIYNFGFQFLDKYFSCSTLFNYAYLGVLNHNNIYFVYILLLLYFSIKENDLGFRIFHKVIIFIIVFMISFLIYLSMYLSFTPVGSLVINGVQNRYFIPLIIPLLLIFSNDKCNNKSSVVIRYVTNIILPLFLIIMSLLYISFLNFYIK